MAANGHAVPRILNVGGHVRSGSTILAMLLGMNSGALTVGEVNLLFFLVAERSDSQYCSCGKLLPECWLWSQVLERFRAALPHLSYARAHEITRKIEALTIKAPADPDWNDYCRIWQVVLQATAEISGATQIIDSSKTGFHSLYRPQRIADAGFDIRLLHIVRDPRAVAWSNMRRAFAQDELHGGVKAFAAGARAALHWNTTNASTYLLYRRHANIPYYQLRYEEFINDPVNCLRDIAQRLDLDFSQAIDIVSQSGSIDGGHVVAGSDIRMKAPLHLTQQPHTWKSALPKLAQVGVMASWPVARYYKYNITDYH